MKLDTEIKYMWTNNKIIKGSNYISTLNASLHYGLCAWEGIKTYKGVPFELLLHLCRLYKSASTIGLKIPFKLETLYNGVYDLIDRIESDNLYIRPVVYWGNAEENKYPFDETVCVDIYAFPVGTLHSNKSVRCMISSYQRNYPNHLMEAKVSSNYLFAELARREAKQAGFDDAILQNNAGYITEATVANLFFKKAEDWYTPPADGHILPGITRSVLMKSFNKCNIIEQPITKSMLHDFDGAIMTGTYAEVVPISQIGNAHFSNSNSAAGMARAHLKQAIKDYNNEHKR